MNAHNPKSLRMRLTAPAVVPAGAPVTFTLTLENTADLPLELHLRGRAITFDVTVRDATGRPVWRLLEGEIVPAILQLRVLFPGEIVELGAEWDQRSNEGTPVPTGEYSVIATLLTEEPAPLAAPAQPLRILSR